MSAKKLDPWTVIEQQNRTIKKLQDNLVKTVLEANIITGKYSEGIAIAEKVIEALKNQLVASKARVAELEVEILNKAWQKGTK